MKIRISGIVLLVCGLLVFRLSADEVLLKNGNVIVGKIVQETAQSITIKVLTASGQGKTGADRFIQMTFQKKDIRRITREANFFKPVTRTGGARKEKDEQVPASPDITPAMDAGKEDAKERGGAAADAKDEDKARESKDNDKADKEEDKLDPALQAQVDSLIDSIGKTKDQKQREAMESRIVAIGKEVAPTVIKALNAGGDDFKRISLIRVIRSLGDKRAVQALINQLKGNSRNTIRMRYAWKTLKSLTGKGFDFDFNQKHKAFNIKKRNRQIARWQKWFDSVKDNYPKQVTK